MKRLIASLLLSPALLLADFDARHWPLRRQIPIPTGQSFVTILLDNVTYRGSRARLDDLRIVRDGAEAPYVLETLRGTADEMEFRPDVLNKAYVESTGLQVTLDLKRRAEHNRLRVTTKERDFKQRVRIETSDNDRDWAVARTDGYIFDFSQGDQQVSVLSVDYPRSTRRYARVSFAGWRDPKSLESVWLTSYADEPASLQTVASIANPPRSEDSKTQTTSLTLDLGADGLPHHEIRFESSSPWFYRPLEFESSTDGKQWGSVGRGVISRTPEYEQLSTTFPEQWTRYMRVRILNHDDQPIPISRVELKTYQRHVRFPSSAAGQYWVYYGNPEARAPHYDLAVVMPKIAATQILVPRPEEKNSAYQPPPEPVKPWTDQHPTALYVLLGVAILAMGVVTVRFLMKVQKSS